MLPGDQRTAKIIQDIANSISPFIKMTVDCPSLHQDGWMPILDLQVKVSNNTIDFKHYRKPMANPLVIMRRSAHPARMKRVTLVQEGIRILRNTRRTLGWEVMMEEMTDLAARLRDSGYDEVYRGEVIRDAVVGYERQVASSDRGEKLLYRPREWRQEERIREKQLKKAAWFRPADSVAFFPATPGGELVTMVRKVLEEEGIRLKLNIRAVETGGISLKSELFQPDLTAGEPCGKPDCLMDAVRGETGGGCSHHRAGAVYQAVCTLFEVKHVI